MQLQTYSDTTHGHHAHTHKHTHTHTHSPPLAISCWLSVCRPLSLSFIQAKAKAQSHTHAHTQPYTPTHTPSLLHSLTTSALLLVVLLSKKKEAISCKRASHWLEKALYSMASAGCRYHCSAHLPVRLQLLLTCQWPGDKTLPHALFSRGIIHCKPKENSGCLAAHALQFLQHKDL